MRKIGDKKAIAAFGKHSPFRQVQTECVSMMKRKLPLLAEAQHGNCDAAYDDAIIVNLLRP